MLKGSNKSKFRGVVFKITAEAILSFKELKRCFSTAPMLVHFNPQQQLILEINLSSEVVGEILSQFIEKIGQWHYVVFWSHKMNIHKKNTQ